jgi:hypothetical protein
VAPMQLGNDRLKTGTRGERAAPKRGPGAFLSA